MEYIVDVINRLSLLVDKKTSLVIKDKRIHFIRACVWCITHDIESPAAVHIYCVYLLAILNNMDNNADLDECTQLVRLLKELVDDYIQPYIYVEGKYHRLIGAVPTLPTFVKHGGNFIPYQIQYVSKINIRIKCPVEELKCIYDETTDPDKIILQALISAAIMHSMPEYAMIYLGQLNSDLAVSLMKKYKK